jgi:ferredoxin
MRQGQQTGAVHSARVGDQERSALPKNRTAALELGIQALKRHFHHAARIAPGLFRRKKQLQSERRPLIFRIRFTKAFMADAANKYSDNVTGKFYVDDQCIDCDLCRETAPANFKRNDDGGHSFVFKQPETPEEEALCQEAMDGCPVEAIGNDS